MGILHAFVLENHVLHIPVDLESSTFSSFQEVNMILNPQGHISNSLHPFDQTLPLH